MLLNYRIDPGPLARVLPAPFRPKLHRERAIGGVCMILMRDVAHEWHSRQDLYRTGDGLSRRRTRALHPPRALARGRGGRGRGAGSKERS